MAGFFRTGGRSIFMCGTVLLTTCYHPPHERTPEWDLANGEERPDRLTAQQELAEFVPQGPGDFSPDPSLNPALDPLPPILDISEETIVTEEAPLPPSEFNPDPGMGAGTAPQPAGSGGVAGAEVEAPGANPFFSDDPIGGNDRFFSRDAAVPEKFPSFVPDIPDHLRLPRQGVTQRRLEAEFVGGGAIDRYEADISGPLLLPRRGVRYEERIFEHWHAEHHEHVEDAPNTTSIEDRYRIPTGIWERYLDDDLAETPYERPTPYLWHPYYQSIYKGDVPVIGSDIFVSLTLQNITDVEIHEIPLPAGISTARAGNAEFYGRGDQGIIVSNTGVVVDIFRGETSFKPVEWLFRINPVVNTNYIYGYETTVVSPDPRGLEVETAVAPDFFGSGAGPVVPVAPVSGGMGMVAAPAISFADNPGAVNPGDINAFLDLLFSPAFATPTNIAPTNIAPANVAPNNPPAANAAAIPSVVPNTGVANSDFTNTRATERYEQQVGLQQFFFEAHLLDLSENYDFAALRVGTQIFNADFRGHVFFDANWGYRFTGNLLKNRLQYNIAFFDLFEKESFSELNTFDDRNQNVFVANVYYQDFLFEGYTAQLNFLANWDNGTDSGLIYDSAGNIVRPAPIGTVAPHDLEAYYIGWNGEGHIGRANISHSLYHVFGTDDLNGVAGREVDISAWMAALELSVDTDWMRHKLTLFYASGDDDATDNKATGWDAIVDNPNLIGGPASYWQRQGFNLGGTGVALKQRLSLIPDLSSNKFLGQSSFVNPGIFIVGIGEEWELTPKVRAFANLNYLMFMDTDTLSSALVTDEIDREIGWDLSFGVQYRPFLTDNVRLIAGLGMLFPGAGFKDIYRTTSPGVPGFSPIDPEEAPDVLYSAFFSATLTF